MPTTNIFGGCLLVDFQSSSEWKHYLLTSEIGDRLSRFTGNAAELQERLKDNAICSNKLSNLTERKFNSASMFAQCLRTQ